jgi:pimeloyl-ACP methyl ester carboxylesterase
MKNFLKKALRLFALPLRMLGVWAAFLIVLWISRGALGGYPALIAAAAAAAALWWRWSRPRSRRAGFWHGVAMLVALAPLAYVLVPLASSTLAPLPLNAAVQMWPTGQGRSVAVYHYRSDAAARRNLTIVFVHGGPGGYIRDFDRDFFATFAKAGFDVVLYDQFGAGYSPLGDTTAAYTHEKNIDDLAAVMARLNTPVVLVGQSYGATLVTSALVRDDVRKRVSFVVLTDPGKIPGASIAVAKTMSEKSTTAPDATLTPTLSVAAKLVAPRAMLTAFLPAGQRFAPQEEIINHYTPDVQRILVSSAFCKGDTALLASFQPLRFNMLANASISRSARSAVKPDLQQLAAPVMMLLGQCSYVPRGRAMEYFGVYQVARAHLIEGVGHVVWGNAKGQQATRDAIIRFVDNVPGALPNDPTRASADSFAASGR